MTGQEVLFRRALFLQRPACQPQLWRQLLKLSIMEGSQGGRNEVFMWHVSYVS